MKEQSSAVQKQTKLQPYLSPLAVWALSAGSAIGWGSLVVTGSTYLAKAGPMGSILGLLTGFAVMLLVAYHYHFLANRYPGTGGLYNYVKYIFGYDRAFLVAWFMFLVYISIFWANATSIPLFARYFLQNVFSVGYLYTIFGYEVYLEEVLVTLAAIALVAVLCPLHGGACDCFHGRHHGLLWGRHARPRQFGHDDGTGLPPGAGRFPAGRTDRLHLALGLYRL